MRRAVGAAVPSSPPFADETKCKRYLRQFRCRSLTAPVDPIARARARGCMRNPNGENVSIDNSGEREREREREKWNFPIPPEDSPRSQSPRGELPFCRASSGTERGFKRRGVIISETNEQQIHLARVASSVNLKSASLGFPKPLSPAAPYSRQGLPPTRASRIDFVYPSPSLGTHLPRSGTLALT